MSAVGLVQEISVILLFVLVTLTFAIAAVIWHLIIVISTLLFNMSVFLLVVDLAVFVFHNHISSLKSSKTIRDLTFREVVITDFSRDSTSRLLQSLLFS